MGLAEWFETFCSNLQVKNKETISQRYHAITKRLNFDFRSSTSESDNSLYVGSYGRNTAIDGCSDIDMVFELPWSYYTKYNNYTSNGQSALLQAVKNSIKTTYPKTEAGGDGQVVVVSFSDGMWFEVLPAFAHDDGSYTFPNSNGGGEWRTTNPRPEIAAIRKRNSDCNNNLIALCRMMRSWKSKWDVELSGLLIDTLAYQFIDAWSHKDKSYFYYDFLCRDFFNFMKEQDETQVFWRAPGSSQYVYGRAGAFQYKSKRCYNIALEAIDYEKDKYEWSAKQKWREIFGTQFPG